MSQLQALKDKTQRVQLCQISANIVLLQHAKCFVGAFLFSLLSQYTYIWPNNNWSPYTLKKKAFAFLCKVKCNNNQGSLSLESRKSLKFFGQSPIYPSFRLWNSTKTIIPLRSFVDRSVYLDTALYCSSTEQLLSQTSHVFHCRHLLHVTKQLP